MHDKRTPTVSTARKLLPGLVGERATYRMMRNPVEGAGARDQGSHRLFWPLAAGDFVQAARFLASHPRMVNVRDGNGWTPLFYTIQHRNTDFLSYLLALGADVGAVDRLGWTPAMEAVRRHANECLMVLLRHGADVSHRSPFGWTALHEAVPRGDVVGIRMLVMAGAPREAETVFGQRPVDLLEACDHPEALKWHIHDLLTRWTPKPILRVPGHE